MEMTKLEVTEAWRMLSPTLREILSAMFIAGDRDLAKAVAVANPHFSTQRAEAIAASMLVNADVQAVLSLQSGEVVLSDAPDLGSLDELVRRKEWADLQPLQIRLREGGDTSDSSESFDLRKILRLYFTTAREDMRAAIEMYRPDLDQPSVALVAKEIWESAAVRRIFALRRGAE